MEKEPTLLEKDRQFIWHPFTQMKNAAAPLPIVRAKGLYLIDQEGHSYIDAISSWWVNLHGHCHPYIVKKLTEQLDKLDHVLFAGVTHPSAVLLAERLLHLLPGNMSKIFYSDNGSCAVEVALKMAIQFWYNKDPNTPKRKVLSFRNSYHGDTYGAMSAAGQNRFNKPFWKQLFEIVTIDFPTPGNEDKSLAQCKNALSSGDIACFIFEPLVLGAGGMILYSKEGLERLIAEARSQKVLIIADEVMTGFGRTGPLFACDSLSEKPDLICLSKGITGGVLPLGATACREELFEQFFSDEAAQAFLHGHSYTANPLACESALASLDLLLDPVCLDARKRISEQHSAFVAAWKGHPKIHRIESLGTLLIIEMNEQKDSYHSYFLANGIFLRPLQNILYLLPPYIIEDHELLEIYKTIIKLLEN